MLKSKSLSFLKRITNIIVYIAIIFLFFVGLELIFRGLYPEFKNQVHSQSITNGKNYFIADFMGGYTRIPYAGYKLESDKNMPILLILGDSITGGYGSAYEDIYWEKFKRLFNNIASSKIRIIALSGNGNSLRDSVEQLVSLNAKSDKIIPIKYVMYQFNFNDITPYGNIDLKKKKHLKGIEHTLFFRLLLNGDINI